MVEETANADGDHDVAICSRRPRGQNIGARGADIVAGDRVVAPAIC